MVRHNALSKEFSGSTFPFASVAKNAPMGPLLEDTWIGALGASPNPERLPQTVKTPLSYVLASTSSNAYACPLAP